MKNNNYTSFFKTKPKKVERYIRCRKCGGNMEWSRGFPPQIKCTKCGYTVYPEPYEPDCTTLPETDDYILLSFANYSIPIIGRCERDKDGNGIFYAGDDLISCLGNDLYVNAWMELPERYREDES